MRRTAGLAVVVTALSLAVTACGNEAVTSTGSLQPPVPKSSARTNQADKATKSALAGLVVLPHGYVADTRNTTGPFTATTYLNSWSADPALDRALLLNANFVEGYRVTRLSPDKKKRLTIQLFKAGSATKAQILQKGLWSPHGASFGVPDALSSTSVDYDGATDQTVALAETSLAVGTTVVELSIRETAPVGTPLTPATALLTTLTHTQRTHLTTTS